MGLALPVAVDMGSHGPNALEALGARRLGRLPVRTVCMPLSHQLDSYQSRRHRTRPHAMRSG